MAEAIQFAMIGTKTSAKFPRLFHTREDKYDISASSAGNKMANVHCLFGFSLDGSTEFASFSFSARRCNCNLHRDTRELQKIHILSGHHLRCIFSIVYWRST